MLYLLKLLFLSGGPLMNYNHSAYKKILKKHLSSYRFLDNRFITKWSSAIAEHGHEEAKNQESVEYYRLDIPISLNQNLQAYINIDSVKNFVLQKNFPVNNVPITSFKIGREYSGSIESDTVFYSKIGIDPSLSVKSEPIIILVSFGNISLVIDGNTRISSQIFTAKNDTISAYIVSIQDLLLHKLYLNDYSKCLLEYRLEFFQIYEKIYGPSSIK